MLYKVPASRFKVSRSCLAVLRSSAFANKEDDDRRPIVGSGTISELNGTTEEKGEYGKASSTVSGRDLVWLDPFNVEAPFEPFTTAPGTAYPFIAIVCDVLRD